MDDMKQIKKVTVPPNQYKTGQLRNLLLLVMLWGRKIIGLTKNQ